MPKEMEELNAKYDEILGTGEPLKDEGGSEESMTEKDSAYGQEDYMDDAGDGTDPREEDDDDLGFEDEDELTGAGSDEDDDKAGGKDDDAGADDVAKEEIPQRLVDAARISGMSDDEIIELSEEHPVALEAIARAQEARRSIGTQQKTVQKDASQQETDKTSSGFKPLELDLTSEDEEEMGSKAVSMIKQLTETVNNLGGKLEQQESSLGRVEQETQSERVRQIDNHFDTVADKVPELGKTVSLTEEQKLNRIFVVNTAQQAMRVYGLSDKDALAMGVNALKGQKSEAKVKNDLVRDLDKNKKRFTARPRTRNKAEGKRSTKDRALEAIDSILDSDDY